jgi:hypothetical protein
MVDQLVPIPGERLGEGLLPLDVRRRTTAARCEARAASRPPSARGLDCRVLRSGAWRDDVPWWRDASLQLRCSALLGSQQLFPSTGLADRTGGVIMFGARPEQVAGCNSSPTSASTTVRWGLVPAIKNAGVAQHPTSPAWSRHLSMLTDPT